MNERKNEQELVSSGVAVVGYRSALHLAAKHSTEGGSGEDPD